MVIGPDRPLWVIVDGVPVRNPDISDLEFAEILESIKQQNISLLWEAAHAYEYAEINGAGIGLLTLGVGQGKPKSLAVMGWTQAIWDLYYQRKPLVTHEWDAALVDFSSVGPMPYTVPELMAEVLGG